MPRDPSRPPKACCMISEILEEAGIDHDRTRQLRRQVLEGFILFCQWQLDRMEAAPAAPRPGNRKARKVSLD